MEDQEVRRSQRMIELAKRRSRHVKFEELHTPHKRREPVLCTSATTVRALLDATFDSALLTDTQGVILALNTRAATRLGKGDEELCGTSAFDHIPPECVTTWKKYISEVVRTGKPVRFEDEEAGMIFHTQIYPVFDANDKVAQVALFSQDSTVCKQAEEGQFESEETYRPVVMTTTKAGMRFGAETGGSVEGNEAAEINLLSQNDFLYRVLQALKHPFYVIDVRDYTIKMANAAVNLGHLSEDSTCYALTHHLDAPCSSVEHKCPLEQIRKIHKPVTTEHIHYDEDGNRRYIEVHGHPILDRQGTITHIIEYNFDITERKRAEEALKLSQCLINQSHDAIFVMEPETGQFLDVNDQACSRLGFDKETLLTMRMMEIDVKNSNPVAWSAHVNQLRQKRQMLFLGEHKKRNGSTFPVEVSIKYVQHNHKDYIVSVARDITERIQAEEKLRTTLQMSDDIVNAIPAGLFIYQYSPPDTLVLLKGNPESERLTGIRTEDYKGKEFDENWPAARQQGITDAYLEVMRTGKTFEVEDLYYEDQQIKGIFRIRAFRLPDDKLAIAFENIAQRKKAEAELQYRMIFENLVLSISTEFINLDSDEIDNGINNALQKIGEFLSADRSYVFQYKENGTFMDNTHEWCREGMETHKERLQNLWVDDFKSAKDMLRKLEVLFIPRVSNHSDECTANRHGYAAEVIQSMICVPLIYGSSILGFVNFISVHQERNWTKDSVQLLKIVGEIFANALMRKRAKEQEKQHQVELAHASRLSNIGEMVSGLAHELNQPLSAISLLSGGCRRIMESETEIPDEVSQALEEIVNQCQQAGQIINSIKRFVRNHTPRRIPARINQIMKEAAKLVEAEGRKIGASVRWEFTDPLPEVIIDPIQIEQVLINLILNAYEAMEEVDPYERILVLGTRLTSENEIEVSIKDTGKGLHVDDAERIFESFFTTKTQGLGLGLSLSHSIIEAHGGRIWMTPNTDHGVTFRFTLPLKSLTCRDRFDMLKGSRLSVSAKRLI